MTGAEIWAAIKLVLGIVDKEEQRRLDNRADQEKQAAQLDSDLAAAQKDRPKDPSP